jgi:hypothetical protein
MRKGDKTLIDEKAGVKAIIALQTLVGIKETEEQAKHGWNQMSDVEKKRTQIAYETLFPAENRYGETDMKPSDICGRCGSENQVWNTSFFNNDWICMNCTDAEMRHPKYQEAKDAEAEAVRKLNYNFQGIGLPEDLKGRTT